MPALIAGAILSILGTIIGQVLVGLLIGFVSYTGIDIGLEYFRGLFLSSASNLPSAVIGVLGVLKVGTSLNILSSAIAAKFALNGLKNGAIKKMQFK